MATKLVLSLALLLSLFAVSSTAEKFDFYYLVQQWPGSFCDTRQGCCFPGTGKPAAEFGIHGLWPNYANCKAGVSLARAALGDNSFLAAVAGLGRRGKCWPEYCNDGNPLSLSSIRDIVTSLDKNWPTLSCESKRSLDFWTYEWKKHGTCSGLDQHDYFASALALKARHSLIDILSAAGIVPSDTATYPLSSIRNAIAEGTGFTANLECNRDADREAQLFQVYQCVDREGKEFIDCPVSMPTKCTDRVQLPTF